MKKRSSHICLSLAVVGSTFFAPLFAAAQAARQGDPHLNPGGYEEFHSPMILETVFLVADRRTWYERRDAWVTNDEYRRLRKFRCERVSIVSLEMNGREISGGLAEIGIRMAVLNPDQNHDKKVLLLLEAVNGDEVGGTLKTGPFKVEEGQTVTKTLSMKLPLSALKTDPGTKLRITMTNWDY